MYLISMMKSKKKKSFITKSTIGMIIKKKNFYWTLIIEKDLNLAKTYL